MNRDQRTAIIKETAKRIGFDYCGISEAKFLEKEAVQLEHWLKQNLHGEMHYMENYFDKRTDPRLLVPGAKSVISLLLNYFPKQQQNSDAPKVSKYAYGEDYHKVIKSKCKLLIEELKVRIGGFEGRCFVDSAPVMDKVWAEKSGLGWRGKHSNLITKKGGSFFFIAEIICDLELNYDNAIKDYCGTCTRCIDACPTEAIIQPYVVDSKKCISYLTIELKESIPQEFSNKMDGWAFGCDVCQDVCPWNRFSTETTEMKFFDHHGFLNWTDKEWKEITSELFEKVFRDSALKRSKFEGIKRNINFIYQSGFQLGEQEE